MAEPEISTAARAGFVRGNWLGLTGGAILAAIVAGFLAIVFTSIHW
jgi:hypothetical protein